MKARTPKQQFTCDLCGGRTTLNRKTEQLADGVEWHYFYTDCCHGRKTIMYTNPEIRQLLEEQQKLMAAAPLSAEQIRQQDDNQAILNQMMAELKQRIEG